MLDLLCENGVLYSHEKNLSPEYYIGFKYTVFHKGKKTADRIVYCKDADDFIKLIRFWNMKDPRWTHLLV